MPPQGGGGAFVGWDDGIVPRHRRAFRVEQFIAPRHRGNPGMGQLHVILERQRERTFRVEESIVPRHNGLGADEERMRSG